MALLFSEKQHWKERIVKITSLKISQLKEHSADINKELKAQAREAVEADLNINARLEEHKKLSEKIESLEGESNELLKEIAEVVFEDNLPYNVDIGDIDEAIKKRIRVCTNTLFAAHPLGQHMEFLEKQKSRLMDEVLLAENSRRISDLLDEAEALTALPQPIVQEEPEYEAQESAEPMLMLSDYSIQ